MEIADILKLSPVIPVLTIEDSRIAIPLAEALVAGGIKAIEISMQTPAAEDAITAISVAVPEIIVGAGMLLDPRQFSLAKKAGAKFLVSPALTPAMLNAAKQTGLPFLPGAATPCEILAAKEMGLKWLKFYPAETLGGVNMLRTLASVFPEIHFYPAGGITSTNMHDYLSLDNVAAVAGTWLAPKNSIENKKWDEITAIARQARH